MFFSYRSDARNGGAVLRNGDAVARGGDRHLARHAAPKDENGLKLVAMEELVGLCKRRGFIFQSSEIYNGFNGFYDYGTIDADLRNAMM
jgi:hypothetical protein